MTDRVDRQQALQLLCDTPLQQLCQMAHALRMEKHPQATVSFVVDTNPNYTNVCQTACGFCSFYRPLGHGGAYVLDNQQLIAKVRRAEAFGATTLLLQGGHHPALGLDYALSLIDSLKQHCPGMHLHLFSPTEIEHFSHIEQCSTAVVLDQLKAKGITTMPGGGAEILVDRVRTIISPNKTRSQAWLDISREAHQRGIKTTATMTYGHVEQPQDIVEHLLQLRELQDETAGFTAFIPWSMKPADSSVRNKVTPASNAMYLRIIALSRLVLDNFPHIQASWFSEGASTGQLALHAGADDFGGVIIEENVLFEAQHRLASTPAAVVNMIEQAGFTARQRTTDYRLLTDFTFSQGTTHTSVFCRNPTEPT